METNLLISEVVQLYNRAAAKRDAGMPDQAKENLVLLRDLLNRELPVEAPGPEPTPDEPSEG